LWLFNALNADLIIVDSITNDTLINCQIVDEHLNFVWSYIDMFNSTLVPFIIMVFCSAIIIHRTLTNRKKVQAKTSKKAEKKKKAKDLKFSITIIALNVIFLVFNLPLVVANFLDIAISNGLFVLYDVICQFYFVQFFSNIFVYMLFFGNFSKELMLLIGIKKKQNKPQSAIKNQYNCEKKKDTSITQINKSAR
jgi:hypothetical protein